jgi:hypothetical protein
VIKLYRHNVADKAYSTITDWAKSFQRFLRSFGSIRKKEIKQNVNDILRATFGLVEQQALYLAHLQSVGIPSAEYEKILIGRIDAQSKEITAEGPWLIQKASRTLLTQNAKVVIDVVSDFVGTSKSKDLIDKALYLASSILLSKYFSPQSSGLVIAGFGEDQIFPAVASFETDGYVGSRLKISDLSETKILFDNRLAVIAYAQHEIVYRFMEGIDPSYSNFLNGLVRTAIVDSNMKVFEKWAPKSKQTAKIKAGIEAAANKAFQRLNDSAIRYRNLEFQFPITQMVAILPKDELANLAESLLTLTSLHRKVSRELETVGGPIDVAIISKGDGFIWVKRKHYFKPELNRHWEMNYMRDAGSR